MAIQELIVLGFLANLRDIKASLTSGMILLFTVWIAFADKIVDVEPGSSVAGNVALLVDYLGPVGTIGVVSFVAYFLGLVLSLDKLVLGTSRALRAAGENRGLLTASLFILGSAAQYLGQTVLNTSRMLFGWPRKVAQSSKTPAFRSRRFNEYVRHRVSEAFRYGSPDDLIERLSSSTSYSSRASLGAIVDFSEPQPPTPQKLEEIISNYVLDEIRGDLDILALQLGHKRERAYDRFEKARSEAEFRAAIVLPLALLTTVLVIHLAEENASPELISVSLIFGLISTVVLAVKAYTKMNESEEEVINAIVMGEIDVPQLSVVTQVEEAGRKNHMKAPDAESIS